MQSFIRFASSKNGRYSGEVNGLPPMLLSRITPFSFKCIDRAMEFFERFVRRVHRDRGKAFESFGMLSDEFGVRVVDHPRDCGLMLRVSKEDVWC